jgi:class 3 adenylate cyclase
MELEVRYVTTSDGVRIAYAIAGSGPPMVTFTDPIASHVQLGWSHPVLGRFFQEMAWRNRVLFFDFRGCGLSDRVQPQSLDDYLRDAEAVVQRVGWREFAANAGGGGTPAAIAFAARHPEQVTRLALADGWARASDLLGTPQVQALVAAAKLDWILATEAIGTVAFGAGREESREYGAYIRSCIGPENIENVDVLATVDASDLASSVMAPTLVLKHSGLQYSTMEMAKDLAARIPNAQLAVVEGTWADDPEGVARRIGEFVNAGTEAAHVTSEQVAPQEPTRSRLVTVLFTDLVRHTEMMSRLGDEQGREVLREHERITREVLKAHGGTEVKTMGDGFMASFGSVTKAVECAVALQRAMDERNRGAGASHPRGERTSGQSNDVSQREDVPISVDDSPLRTPVEPISVRVGLNAGEPIEEEGDLFGATVILASRIAAKAEGGEILVADTVRGLCSGKGFLFADRGEFVAKGFEEPARVYEVRWSFDSPTGAGGSG